MAEIRIRNQGKITVQDADSSNEVSLQAPSTVASNQEFTLPSTSGSANNIITTNASGVLSMTDINTLITSDIAWQSTVQYNNITLESGKGYFINTTAGPTTMTLPSSPSAGDFVALKDYAGTFGTNKLTIDRNGSNIQGLAANSDLTTDRASVVLVYVDSTEGWLYTVENNVGDLGPPYVAATGGTITTSGDFKIHTFTGDGTFTVTAAGNSSGSNTVDYLVVAGGGAGYCGVAGGGGGAGGHRESFPNPATGGLSVSAQAYPIQVGSGGAANTNGEPSIFSSITSAGGGSGGNYLSNGSAGGSGGGGGGTDGNAPSNTTGGAGNTPPVSPPQGNNGGSTPAHPTGTLGGSGGGGIGSVGVNAPTGPGTGAGSGAAGGNGTASSINASPVTRAGGGGGGNRSYDGPSSGSGAGGPAGPGGGGKGGGTDGTATNGTANTGGGGGGKGFGSFSPNVVGTGGSGVVIIRYKYQN
tara:strand:- start:3382 stop:4794 length:1413 start_codon:yes stop_codon:yes gene_type:complete